MKYSILLIILIIPFTIAAQFGKPIYEIDFSEVDSVSMVEYGAVYRRTPLPKPFPKNATVVMKDSLKNLYRLKREDFMNKYYPNTKVGRDMPRPPRTQTIIDENGLFYPNANWATYRSFPRDSVLTVLGILNCEIHTPSVIDSFILDGEMVYTKKLRNRSPATCFAPGFGIILWSKGKVLQLYSVCFGCNRTAVGYKNESGRYDYQSCIDLEYLKSELKKMGYLKSRT